MKEAGVESSGLWSGKEGRVSLVCGVGGRMGGWKFGRWDGIEQWEEEGAYDCVRLVGVQEPEAGVFGRLLDVGRHLGFEIEVCAVLEEAGAHICDL